MSRYDDLQMREAKPVTKKVTENTPVTENVTLNTPVTINPMTTNTPIPITPKLKRGRPKTGKALSGAERTRRYRQRLREARQ
jgi:hypothetical protein